VSAATERRVLVKLEFGGPMTAARLAEVTGLSLGRVHCALRDLVAAGAVKRGSLRPARFAFIPPKGHLLDCSQDIP
jgi:sugar-specific transcriptional regulator TrmB